MTGIVVESKTARAQKQIAHIIEADNNRSDWHRFFSENIESTDPFIIKVEHKNAVARRLAPVNVMRDVVCRGMDKAGLREGVDYEVKFV